MNRSSNGQDQKKGWYDRCGCGNNDQNKGQQTTDWQKC